MHDASTRLGRGRTYAGNEVDVSSNDRSCVIYFVHALIFISASFSKSFGGAEDVRAAQR